MNRSAHLVSIIHSVNSLEEFRRELRTLDEMSMDSDLRVRTEGERENEEIFRTGNSRVTTLPPLNENYTRKNKKKKKSKRRFGQRSAEIINIIEY